MTDAAALAAFHDRRDAAARGDQGWISLVRTAWIAAPTTLDEVQGTWAPSSTADALDFTPAHGQSVSLDGSPVTGTVTVPVTAGPRGILRFDDTTTGTVIERDGQLAARIWNTASEHARAFQGISAYPFDEAWRLTGTFEPVTEGVVFAHGKFQGGEYSAVSPGVVRIMIDGSEYALVGFESAAGLQIVFRDATAGRDTYEAARFVFAKISSDGSAILDFNRAVVPPCSMSEQFNCAMPPASNRITTAITAGEQLPHFTS